MNGDDWGRPGAGDGADTFERWYRAHHARLLSQCRRILGDAASAEDVAQETLLRAWLGRERMREEDLGAWLAVVARNLCISHLRRFNKQIPTEILPESADESADPARVVERLESRRAVRRAILQMGERHRKLLLLREFEGIDYDELGEELGLSAAGTRTVLFRARRVLRDRLAAVGEGLAAFVAGVRIRIRSALVRGRSAAGSAGAATGAAAPGALNLVMALGVTFAVFGGGSAFGTAQANRQADTVSDVITLPARAGNSPATKEVRVEATAYRRSSDEFVTPWLDRPTLDPPKVAGTPYRCGEGDTLITVEAAGQSMEVYNWRERGELTQSVYDVEDVAFNAASDRAPGVCKRLARPIGVGE